MYSLHTDNSMGEVYCLLSLSKYRNLIMSCILVVSIIMTHTRNKHDILGIKPPYLQHHLCTISIARVSTLFAVFSAWGWQCEDDIMEMAASGWKHVVGQLVEL